VPAWPGGASGAWWTADRQSCHGICGGQRPGTSGLPAQRKLQPAAHAKIRAVGPELELSGQRAIIADHLKRCSAPFRNPDRPMISVIIDTDGIARVASVSPNESGRFADPRFLASAETAIRAILSPHCENFPLPASMRGRVVEIEVQAP
jgi:hypothetical protein